MDIHDLAGRPVIIGGGIAGLMTALHLAPEPVRSSVADRRLAPMHRARGRKAALPPASGDDDDPALHLADTLAAGDGLCDEGVATRILHAAPAAIEELVRFGVRFDRTPDGTLRLGLEAAHSRRRIVHAGGDGSGRRDHARTGRRCPFDADDSSSGGRRSASAVRGGWQGDRRAGADRSTGPWSSPRGASSSQRAASADCFHDTTNPVGSCGQGLALAARAGAALADLEFIQFHPTALDGPGRPMTLISEAVRGEGATIVDETGERFLDGCARRGTRTARHRRARRLASIWRRAIAYSSMRGEKPGAAFARSFPTIASPAAAGHRSGARPRSPSGPPQHYHMGGVAVDHARATSVAGLWACGEVASTGLHGANRLASNSLTEAVVCARRVAESVAGSSGAGGKPTVAVEHARLRSGSRAPNPVARPRRHPRRRRVAGGCVAPCCRWRSRMAASDPAIVGLMITISALLRRESRGAHFRTDYPNHAAAARRSEITLDAALAAARELAHSPAQESVI